jgi:outer membrane biosynthesis protein TonB
MLPIILALLLQLPAAAGLIPAKLLNATSPIPPPNAVAGTCVLADVQVDSRGRIGEVKILEGLGPFNDSATRAIKQWQFSPATLNSQPVASRVGVLTVFRPPALGNIGSGGPSFGYKQPTPPKNSHPPLPISITAPDYPQTATTEGVVIIDVPIDKNGNPLTMLTVQDIPQFTDIARAAIRSWKFMPAVESGQPVVGMLIVAISFRRPVVVIQQ